MGTPSNPTASQAQVFNDGGVQFGAFSPVAIYIGPSYAGGGQPNAPGTQRGNYIVESGRVQRSVGAVLKPDEIGGPNGLVLVKRQITGNCVIQMGDNTVPRPQSGDWFSYQFDTINSTEYFVLGTQTDAREQAGYWKGEFELYRVTFPAYTSTFTPP